jgi:histidine triad (HIT) family protein
LDDTCLFCKIRDGEIPAKKVYEDEVCFAFEDIDPQASTHLLICPREHVASLAEAGESHETVLGHLSLVAAKLARERGVEAYRTVVNTGPEAGQSVFHIHLHLLGGRPFAWPPG